MGRTGLNVCPVSPKESEASPRTTDASGPGVVPGIRKHWLDCCCVPAGVRANNRLKPL